MGVTAGSTWEVGVFLGSAVFRDRVRARMAREFGDTPLGLGLRGKTPTCQHAFSAPPCSPPSGGRIGTGVGRACSLWVRELTLTLGLVITLRVKARSQLPAAVGSKRVYGE